MSAGTARDTRRMAEDPIFDRVHRDLADRSRTLAEGLSDPEAFFAQRGCALRCHETDGEWWADLAGVGSDRPGWIGFGGGATKDLAMASAVRRWLIEQEAPDPKRRPGDRLP